MDSGNSGSMQSSSGGEEEYDSRGESISSFLNSSAHFGSISDPQTHLLSSHQQQPTLFNPHSQNLDHAFPQSLGNSSGNSQFGNDLVWSRGLRSEPNYGNFGNLTSLSSSSASSLSSSSQSVLGAAQGLNHHQVPFPSSSSMPSQSVEGNAARTSQQSDQPNMVKNPKKRTRASRRAPTTVLTTDTTNFRQMVQEFTGIPTAPFSGSPYSRRLDLFSTGSSMRTGHLDALGPLYPLRPSAQKIQLNPFFPSSSSPSLLNSGGMDPLVPSTTTNVGTSTNNPSNNNNSAAAAGTSNAISTSATHEYQIASNLGLPKQPQDLLSMQNQMLAFQPLLESSLHPSLKHPSSSSVLSTKSQGNTSHVPSFDDLGLSHENVNANLGGFQSQGSSDAAAAQRWRDGGTLNSGNNQEQLGSSSQRNIPTYKFNCSASTSEFHPDKGLENVTSTGEGTVGSWICPSD